MKILAAISLVLATLFILIMLYGISLSNQIEVTEIIQIDAPVPVVWNTLAKFDEHSKWQKSIKSLYNYNNSTRQVHYNFEEETILVNQQVRVRKGAKAIDFFQIGSEQFTSLEGFSGQIVLEPLADGSTEVRWKIMYSTKTLSQKIVSNLSIEGKFRDLLTINLEALKIYIEK